MVGSGGRVVACCALASVALAHQEPAVFRGSATIVPIYATVTGPDGRMLTNLTKADFTVIDDGRYRPITEFSAQPTPLTGLFMWDVSPAQNAAKGRPLDAALALVKSIWEDDRVRFGTFSGQEFAVSPILTGDKTTLRRVVDEELWFSTAQTPLWQALKSSLAVVAREQGRRVLVITSSGKSFGDPGSKREVVREVQTADTMVFALGFEVNGLSSDLREVTEESGGGFRELRDGIGLQEQIEAVVAELHHQYLLGFVPDVIGDGRLRPLRVEVSFPGAKVRARRSYVAGTARR